MKYLLPFILLISTIAIAQNTQLQRYDNFAATTASASGIGNLTQVIPNATLQVFNYPGAGISCAGGGCVAATTYTNRTGVTTCGAGVPLTRPTSTTCLATADAQGNFGFWASTGVYQYCVLATTFTTQCYNINLGAPPLNVRILDGTSFAFSAAGINAADADLGANNNGEIWIPSGATVNATDAQITIGGSHTLRVLGTLNIDAVNKGAIIVGKYTHVTCSNTSNGNGGPTGLGQIVNTGSGTMPGGMLRTNPQDGSLETFYVDSCTFYGGGQGVTTGMIDISGMNDKGWVRDNLIYGYTSGWGIYDTDIQSGVKQGTSNIEISGNWIEPSTTGTGGCLEVLHSATNLVILQQFHIRNNECQLNAASSIATAPIIFQNTSAGGGNLRTMDNSFWLIQGVPAGVPSITINGLQSSTFQNITCGGGSTTCISITNNAVNASIHFKNIHLFTGTNVIVDNQNSITMTAPSQDYEFYLSTAGTQTQARIVVPWTFDRPIVSATGTGLQLTEGSAPTGIGLVDQLWGDSANHAVGFILSANTGPEIAANNNGGWTIGSIAGQTRIDSAGTTNFPFRALSSGNAFTGLQVSTFQAVGSTPTLTGTGACATTTTQVGGTGAGNFTCTGTTGASTVTLTFASTAAHWYSCFGSDTTHTLVGSQSGTVSTTACTLTFTSVTANDIITFGAIAF